MPITKVSYILKYRYDNSLININLFQVASLQQKIVAEDKAVEARTLEFLAEWERSKPTDGSTRPEDALARLQAMETRYTRLKDERDNVAKAKEALELHDTGEIIFSSSFFLLLT